MLGGRCGGGDGAGGNGIGEQYESRTVLFSNCSISNLLIFSISNPVKSCTISCRDCEPSIYSYFIKTITNKKIRMIEVPVFLSKRVIIGFRVKNRCNGKFPIISVFDFFRVFSLFIGNVIGCL